MHAFPKLLIVATCVAVACSFSAAQPPKGKKGDDFKGGPKLSDAEMVDDIVTRMMAFDLNKDGKLTRDEITDARLLRLFERADANKNGFVTRDELMAVAKQMVAELAAEGGGKGPKGDKGPKGGKGPGGPDKFGPPGKGGLGGPGKFGPPPDKAGGPPQAGQIIPLFMQESLNLTDDQRRQL